MFLTVQQLLVNCSFSILTHTDLISQNINRVSIFFNLGRNALSLLSVFFERFEILCRQIAYKGQIDEIFYWEIVPLLIDPLVNLSLLVIVLRKQPGFFDLFLCIADKFFPQFAVIDEAEETLHPLIVR